MRDFPDGPVVKALPVNAEGVGSISGQGTKIPYAEGYSQRSGEKKKKVKS